MAQFAHPNMSMTLNWPVLDYPQSNTEEQTLDKIRSSYNLSGMSFTPKELAAEITKHYPNFTINYEPDFRQKIADSWPASIDDSAARKDWGWKSDFNIENMTVDMFKNLKATIYK